MKTSNNLKIGQKVAKFTDRSETECYAGVVRAKKENKALVYFANRYLSRWCNVDNLHPITKA